MNLREQLQAVLDQHDSEERTGRTTQLVQDLVSYMITTSPIKVGVLIHAMHFRPHLLKLIEQVWGKQIGANMFYDRHENVLTLISRDLPRHYVYVSTSVERRWPRGMRVFEDHHALRLRVQRELDIRRDTDTDPAR